eukprot:4278508-Prymnesium_polylepis.1
MVEAMQSGRHYNRPAGPAARSDRPHRSGEPMDHQGPSAGDRKGVHARSQTRAHNERASGP